MSKTILHKHFYHVGQAYTDSQCIQLGWTIDLIIINLLLLLLLSLWVGLKASLGQAMQNLANLFPSSKPTHYLNSIFKMWLVMKCIQVRLAELCSLSLSLSLFCEFELNGTYNGPICKTIFYGSVENTFQYQWSSWQNLS